MQTGLLSQGYMDMDASGRQYGRSQASGGVCVPDGFKLSDAIATTAQ
jgi:hypothetical protein